MSTPFPVRRGSANEVVLVSACTSTNSGREPSMVTAIDEPAKVSARSARKASEGLSTSFMPPCSMAKTPTSLVAPKRFLVERSSRKAW